MKRDVCRIDFSRGWNEDLLRIKFYGLLDTYCVPFKSEGNLFRLMAKLKTFPPIKSLLREFCRFHVPRVWISEWIFKEILQLGSFFRFWKN